MNADQWNQRYPIGTPVLAYPGVRPDHPLAIAVRQRQTDGMHVDLGDADLCRALTTVTRTPAWNLGHGDPVVSVEGYAGGISLTHVVPICGSQCPEHDHRCLRSPGHQKHICRDEKQKGTESCTWDSVAKAVTR
ncbi:hypothetical protein [Streptomyces griseofuscus]|uniref:hypothetical protein n=1 Tax=Streptomyces griseofuscus TaxID=146922 RepID=UPI0033D35175